MPGPLSGLRVVDCSSSAAGLRAGGFLADVGADVIWVERPGGSYLRRDDPVASAVFNRGKRSIVVDPDDPTGREILGGLLGWADVLIETEPPPGGGRPGLTQADPVRYPSLVHCAITGYGLDGPHRDLAGEEALVHAVVGTMAEQAGHRQGPIYEGVPFATAGAAGLAVFGILAALHRRADDGRGRLVDTSLLDGALLYLAMLWGDDDGSPTNAPAPGTYRLITRSFRCADDEYLGVHTGAVGAFGRFMHVAGLAGRIPASASGMDIGMPLAPEHRSILDGELDGIMASRPRAEWVRLLREADVCAVEHLHPGEVFDQPQVRHNAMVVTVDDPVLGPMEQVAPPLRLPAHTTGAVGPAPRADEHHDEILALLHEGGGSRGDRVLGAPLSPIDDRPLLQGVTILDLGAYYAGPYSSRLMADLGADVIKLEPPAGDQLRGLARVFRTAQAGKRSVAVDLKHPAARAIAAKLMAWADVVHHNLRPGAAERLGLAEPDVRAVNPGAVYLYAPGWGATGPDAGRQSFAPMLSGFVGAGYEAAGQLNPPLFPVGNEDPGNGLLGAIGMMLGLLHRRRTGEGLMVENPQLNVTMTHLAHIARLAGGEVVGAGRLDPLQTGVSALNRLYQTADGWICLVAEHDHQVAALGRAVGVDLLGDARFSSAASRVAHDYELGQELAGTLAGRGTRRWLEAMAAEGVPAAEPVPHNNLAFMRDPENRRTGRVAEVTDPAGVTVREAALLVRISGARLPPYRLAPELGAHTDAVLAWLGYPPSEIDELRASGAIR